MLSPATWPRALKPRRRAWIGWLLPIVSRAACSASGDNPQRSRRKPHDDHRVRRGNDAASDHEHGDLHRTDDNLSSLSHHDRSSRKDCAQRAGGKTAQRVRAGFDLRVDLAVRDASVPFVHAVPGSKSVVRQIASESKFSAGDVCGWAHSDVLRGGTCVSLTPFER